MPNSLAILMMSVWPFVTLAMYLWMPRSSAVIWSILGGYLALPAAMALDLPLLPGLSKVSIPSLFGYLYASALSGRLIPFFPRHPLARVFVGLLLFGPLLTVATNGDPIVINSNTVLPGLRLYDAVSMVIGQLGALCSWALAREFLRSRAALRELVVATVVAILIYTVPMLYEVRMSPQLHTMIYGFFQHDFLQMMRQSGFRPIVFLEHALVVAMVTAMAAMLSVVLARMAPEGQKTKWYLAAGYLMVVLVLCKSIAALVYALVLMPPLLLLSPRRLAQIAVLMAVLVMTYPILRAMDVIPTDWLVETAGRYSVERAQSLQFRFDNEDALLAHAIDRPLFGWGGWGRSFIYDPLTGENVSVTDGLWVIAMGTGGFLGFIALFGLLTAPIFTLIGSYRRIGHEIPVMMAGMAVVLGTNLVDLLPNAAIMPLTWLLSGAILGHLEALGRDPVPDDGAAVPRVDLAQTARGGYAGLVGRPAEGPRTLI